MIGERSFVIDRSIFIPDELKKLNQWVLWRMEDRGKKKLTKKPYNARTGGVATSTDPKTWSSFTECVAAYEDNDKWSGIGFVFTVEDPYCGLDIDGGLNEDLSLTPECQKILSDFGASYTEISRSGRGLHVIGRGKVGDGKHNDAFEMYDWGRYFIVTGDVFDPANRSEIIDVQNGINLLLAPSPNCIGPKNKSDWKSIDIEINPEVEPSISKYLALLESDAKIKKTITRKRTNLKDNSPSGYDMALASQLVAAGWSDQDIIDMCVYVRRKNGDDTPRKDYWQRTIAKAREGKIEKDLIGGLETLHPDDKQLSLSYVQKISGLPITAIIQIGERDSHWMVKMDGGMVWDFPTTKHIRDLSNWQDVCMESGREMFKISKKIWPEFVKAMSFCRVLQKFEEVTVPGQISDLLNQYIARKKDSMPDYKVNPDEAALAFISGKPFLDDGKIFISAGNFAEWSSITHSYKKSSGFFASALSGMGFTRSTIVKWIDGKNICRSFYIKTH